MYHRERERESGNAFIADPFHVLCVEKDRKESHVIHYSIKRAGEKKKGWWL